MLDDFYYATLSVDRKHFLATDLNAIVQAIDMTSNKDLMTQMADRMGVKPNKTLVVDMLKQYVNVLTSDNCSEEQYHEIYEKTGHISQFRDFKSNAAQLYDMMFEEQNPKLFKDLICYMAFLLMLHWNKPLKYMIISLKNIIM